MEMMIWNILLTGCVAVVAFLFKGKLDHIDGQFAELDRISILLNKTREEVAREHVTRAEVNQMLDRLADRIDKSIQRLELKLDGIKKG